MLMRLKMKMVLNILLKIFDATFASTSYVNVENFTFQKDTNSTTRIDITTTFSQLGIGATTPKCYLENLITGEKTINYSRHIATTGDTGSSGLIYLSNYPSYGRRNLVNVLLVR